MVVGVPRKTEFELRQQLWEVTGLSPDQLMPPDRWRGFVRTTAVRTSLAWREGTTAAMSARKAWNRGTADPTAEMTSC